MFACRKSADFEGKRKITETRPLKRLAAFTVAPEVPLNGTEPIYRNGNVVGYLRRGGFGYSIQCGLGTGYVALKDKPKNKSIKDFILEGQYEIDVMGQLHPAKVSLRPLFDPDKKKMKVQVQ